MRAVALAVLMGAVSFCALSDVIYLTNGNSIEGVIEKEDATSVVLNVGAGTIKLRKSQIASIERGDPHRRKELEDQWRQRYFIKPEYVPETLKNLAKEYRDLVRIRKGALKAKANRARLMRRIKKLQKKVENLNENISELSKRLAVAKPDTDPESYNTLVGQYNALVARLATSQSELNRLIRRSQKPQEPISEYFQNLEDFRNRLQMRIDSLGEGANKQERDFLQRIEAELAKMSADFTKYAIGYRSEGSSVVVEAVVNEKVQAPFIVDTGASLVVLPPSLAQRLGISTKGRQPTLDVTVADGRHLKAYLVTLDSISVGEAHARNVDAAVLAGSQQVEMPGLLGMSFLERFVIKIDMKSNRLILEEFRP